jgi:hypothetical protein
VNNDKDKNLNPAQDFTSEEKDIRFNSETDQEQKTEDKLKTIKKPRKAKWYFLIPAVFIIILLFIFIGWHIKQKKIINVCLLDKTVLTVEEGNEINIDSIYRKHQGFYWLLEQKKYTFEDKNFYDYKKDYFGLLLDENGLLSGKRELSTLDYVPDLMYISDVYGAVDDTYGYYDSGWAKEGGVTVDEMSVISYAYENGATVVAEMELFNSGMESSVYSQLTSLCGVNPTGWVGRYVYDLQDFTDVPDWAPPMYEAQEGVEWQFEGPGIILVSSEKIIILEQKTDFNSKNLLQIYINDEYKKEFKGCKTLNFYNWFEIVEPTYNSEVLANFEFDVNATGMEKLKGVLKAPRFAAAIRKVEKDKSPVYYFSGDFNDYVDHENYNRFLFADTVYRWISYDIAGDISHFYWKFYNPFMSKVLSEIKHIDEKNVSNGPDDIKITDNAFKIQRGENAENFKPKAISINANEPGVKKYSKNYAFYEELVKAAADLNADTIFAKDLLPAEFYRAVYSHNSKHTDKPIYIIQQISAPAKPDEAEWEQKIKYTLDAIHGEGTAPESETLQKSSYFIDVSSYVLGVVIDGINANDNYTYDGTYTQGTEAQGFGAYLYDTAQKYNTEKYGKYIAIGLNGYSDNIINIFKDDTCKNEYFFASVSHESVVLAEGEDYTTFYKNLSQKVNNRLLVTGVGVSSNVGIYNIVGTPEKEQGLITTELLKNIDSADILGAVVFDLNDDWTAVSEEMYPFTVPTQNNYLWQNVADPAQTSGFVAISPKTPKQTGINLSDDDRVQMMSLSANEGYFYITLQLLTDIDHSIEKFVVGIDTYQRNDGEYYFLEGYTPTSLSGMEFVINFDSKQDAGLYVTKSYNRSLGGYQTKESYTGKYDLVSKLNYGGFTSGDNQFYQTGSTIYIRIPWSWLNVTDPSSKIVLNDVGVPVDQAKTVSTNGAIVSALIVDKATKDQLYLFPETKNDPSYKTFKWETWEKCEYSFSEKEGYTILAKYFSSK